MKLGFRPPLALIALLLFCLLQAAMADGLVVARSGGLTVLRGDDLSVVRQLETGETSQAPLVAAHPAAPVLVTLDGQKLTFWNLPGFDEASRHENELFEGATELTFSLAGDELYVLSEAMRGILVFDLAASRVARVIPLPGGDPRRLQVTRSGLLVEAGNGVSLLSKDEEPDLLAQYRYPEEVLTAAISDGRIYLARSGATGLDSYELLSGRALGPVFEAGRFKALLASPGASGLLALTTTGAIELWSHSGKGPVWSFTEGGRSFDAFLLSRDGSILYALDGKSQQLVALEAVSGKKLAQGAIVGAGLSRMSVFSD